MRDERTADCTAPSTCVRTWLERYLWYASNGIANRLSSYRTSYNDLGSSGAANVHVIGCLPFLIVDIAYYLLSNNCCVVESL
jgi:hypothetical protein